MSKDKRKKRTEAICGTTASAEITSIRVSYNHATGEISFGADMINVYSEVSYERLKGQKVLSRVPQKKRQLSFSTDEALEKNYEYIVAADTNTATIEGKEVSVTGVVTATPTMLPGPKGLRNCWKFDVPFCIEFIGAKKGPENLGWAATLEQLHLRGCVTSVTKIGMIVDSNLGNIPAYNARTKEILPGILLPAAVQLIYASADTGKENIINKIIAVADSVCHHKS